MTINHSRRQFLGTVAAGSVSFAARETAAAPSVAAPKAAAQGAGLRPAVLGGTPVRTAAFPSWPVQVWRIGTVTLLALGGEVVSDYALRLKREHASERLWVAAYANDVSCYVPSLRVLDEGGYEGGGAMLYYGRPGPFTRDVEQRLVAAATHLMTHVR